MTVLDIGLLTGFTVNTKDLNLVRHTDLQAQSDQMSWSKIFKIKKCFCSHSCFLHLVIQRSCPHYLKIQGEYQRLRKKLSYHLHGQSKSLVLHPFNPFASIFSSFICLINIPPKVSHTKPEEIIFRIHQKQVVGVLQPAAVSVYEHDSPQYGNYHTWKMFSIYKNIHF